MDKKHIPLVLLLVAGPGFAGAAELPREAQARQQLIVATGDYLTPETYRSAKLAHSYCHRNRVVWSGGIARRGPDRIRPRPVRSRWQGADENRIFCPGGNAFSRKRVADDPWLR